MAPCILAFTAQFYIFFGKSNLPVYVNDYVNIPKPQSLPAVKFKISHDSFSLAYSRSQNIFFFIISCTNLVENTMMCKAPEIAIKGV